MRTSNDSESLTSRSRRPLRSGRPCHLVLPLLTFALLACASSGPAAAQAAEEDEGLQVTVMIYSGRQNPTFTIEDGALIEELQSAVSSGERREDLEGRTVVPSILGYNGIRVENRSGVAGLPPVLLLYGGTMEARDGGTRFLADPDRRLERRLVDAAVERGLFREDDRALGLIREALEGGTSPVS
jgi:hypothetical protein